MKIQWISVLYLKLSLVMGMSLGLIPVSTQAGKLQNTPTAIYFNGDIVTVDKNMSYVDAVAVKDDQIIAVGSMGEIQRLSGADTKKIDLQGKTMLPGFYDAHGHFGLWIWRYVALGSGPFGPIKNIPDLVAALAERAEITPLGETVFGWGYDDVFMEEQAHPTRLDLDQASTDHPITITHFSGHGEVINTNLLEQTWVDYPPGTITPDPPGGVIGRFPADHPTHASEPNGQFFGASARALLVRRDGTSFVPPPTNASRLEDIAVESEIHARVGTTTANNGGLANLATFNLYKQAADEGYLKIRSTLWFSLLGAIDVHNLLGGDIPGESRKLPKYAGKNELVVANSVKYFSDGSPQLRTAYMSDPYHTTGEHPSDWRGLQYMTSEQVKQAFVDTHEAGFDQIHIHCNGDGAVDNCLDGAEEVRTGDYRQSDDLRHTIIHSQFTREEQFDRMAQLKGVIPSFLGMHIYYLGDRHWEIFFGPDRSARMSAAQDAVDRNIIWTTHADTPVFEHNPLLLMWAQVNRMSYGGREIFTRSYDQNARYRSVDQRVTPEEALRAITINAAYQEFEDEITGSIEVGKRADLVILEENPLKVDPMHIKDIKVLETIVGGETVFERVDSDLKIEKLINHRVRATPDTAAQLLAGTRYRVDYKVTNNSPDRLYNVQVFEDGKLVCNLYNLAPGQSKQPYRCANFLDVLTGFNKVSATVTAKATGSGQSISGLANAYYTGHSNVSGQLKVTHYVNEKNADTQSTAVDVNGNKAEVKIRVENTGFIELYRVKLYHDPASPVNSGWQELCYKGTLVPGEVRYCKRTISTTQAGLNAAFGRAQGLNANNRSTGYVNATNLTYFDVMLP